MNTAGDTTTQADQETIHIEAHQRPTPAAFNDSMNHIIPTKEDGMLIKDQDSSIMMANNNNNQQEDETIFHQNPTPPRPSDDISSSTSTTERMTQESNKSSANAVTPTATDSPSDQKIDASSVKSNFEKTPAKVTTTQHSSSTEEHNHTTTADCVNPTTSAEAPQNEQQQQQQKEEEEEEEVKWSETLRSPSNNKLFSPAYVNYNAPARSSLHGLGLTVAVDRARSLSNCGKSCASLLFELSSLYEAFGVSILKATNDADPIIVCMQQSAASSSSNTIISCSDNNNSSHHAGPIISNINSTYTYTSTSTHSSNAGLHNIINIHNNGDSYYYYPAGESFITNLKQLKSLGTQMRGLSICIKNSVSRPLRDSSITLGDTAPKIFQQYAETREQSIRSRKNALKLRLEYVKCVKEADVVVRGLKVMLYGDDDDNANPSSSLLVKSPVMKPVSDERTVGDISLPALENHHGGAVGNKESSSLVSLLDGGGIDDAAKDISESSSSVDPAADAEFSKTSELSEQRYQAQHVDVTTSTKLSPSGGGVNGNSSAPKSDHGNKVTNKAPITENNNEQNYSVPANKSSTSIPSTIKKDKSKIQAGWAEAVRIFTPGSSIPLEELSRKDAIERAVQCLITVRESEVEYSLAVDEENAAVSRCQTVEHMGLESLQNLEEERLWFFHETLLRLMQAERGSLDNMNFSLHRRARTGERADGSVASASARIHVDNNESTTVSSKGKEQQQSPMESVPRKERRPSLAARAATGDVQIQKTLVNLDIPQSVAPLRERMLESVHLTKERCKVIEFLLTMVQEFIDAADSFVTQVGAQLALNGYGEPNRAGTTSNTQDQDRLVHIMKQSEGKHVMKCWNSVIRSILHCCKAMQILVGKLGEIRVNLKKLQQFSEKDMASAADSEEMRWKHLCDAGKNERKARELLDQSALKLEKATERLHILAGAGKADENFEFKSTSAVMNKSMRKALGNVFSVIPGVGEEAVLTQDDRFTLSKDTFDEAQFREAHHKAAWQTSLTAKKQAIKSYTDAARTLEKSFDRQEEIVWNKMLRALQGCLSVVHAFRDGRYHVIEKATSIIQLEPIQKDMIEWTKRLEDKLVGHRKKVSLRKESSDMSASDGNEGTNQSVLEDNSGIHYVLEFFPEKNENIDELLVKEKQKGDNFAFLKVNEAERKNSSSELDHANNDGSSPVAVTRRMSDYFQLSSKEDLEQKDDSIDASQHESNTADVSLQRRASSSAGASSTTRNETEVFMYHFYPDGVKDGEEIPTVIQSFSCAYWPKDSEGHIAPLLHGRMFVTSISTLCFVGWAGKKIALNFEEIMSVEKEATLYGLVPNALLIKTNDDQDFLFGSFAFREDAFNLLNRLSVVARSLNELNGGAPSKKKITAVKMKPDPILSKMEVVVKGNLKGVTIDQLHSTCWSETEDAPFYLSWLIDVGSLDVVVGDWESDPAEGFVNSWDEEAYTHRRTVTYKYKRTTHLYIGPPIAEVTQVQYYRAVDDLRCVLAMNVKIDGIPYADTFTVQVRWVGTRDASAGVIRVEVGLFIDFKKSSLLNSKIRSATISETTATHQNLFESIKLACKGNEAVNGEGEDDEDEVADEEETNVKPSPTLQTKLKYWTENFQACLEYCRKITIQYRIYIHLMLLCMFLILIIYCCVAYLTDAQKARKELSVQVQFLMAEIKSLKSDLRDMKMTTEKILQQTAV